MDTSLIEDPIPEETYAAPFHEELPDATEMEEVQFLRMMVHKLNVELGKLQSKVKQQDGTLHTGNNLQDLEIMSWGPRREERHR